MHISVDADVSVDASVAASVSVDADSDVSFNGVVVASSLGRRLSIGDSDSDNERFSAGGNETGVTATAGVDLLSQPELPSRAEQELYCIVLYCSVLYCIILYGVGATERASCPCHRREQAGEGVLL